MGLDMYLKAEVPCREDKLWERLGVYGDDEVYVDGWSHSSPEEQENYRRVLLESGLAGFSCPDSPSVTVSRGGVCLTIGYWRKANQIHKWFVENCQDGVDECQRSNPISKDQLLELRSLCQQVIDGSHLVEGMVNNGYTFKDGVKTEILEEGRFIDDSSLAQMLLPTESGFFFGSTDYDEGYIDDLKHTIEVIDKALKLPDDAVITYRSSW